MGIKHKAWVNRNHEPVVPDVEHHEVAEIGALADLLGLPKTEEA